MFSKKKNYSLEDSSTTIIAEGTDILGDVKTEGSMRLDGNIKGDITVRGKLVIGPAATVEGNIKAYDCEINGKIKGAINVDNLVTLMSKCAALGDITTKNLIVESGATFNGNCFMGDNASSVSENNTNR